MFVFVINHCIDFAPCGPLLVTEDELGDPHQLDIELRLNGNLQQSSNTSNLIFDCYTLVSFISQTVRSMPSIRNYNRLPLFATPIRR